MKEKFYVPILRIVGVYVVFALLWIFLSDRVLYFFFPEIDTFLVGQTWKGFFFVITSAILLFFLLRRENQIRDEAWKSHNKKLVDAWDASIEGWSRTIELRDEDTRHHSARAVEITLQIAKQMGINNEEELRYIRWGALLHDIGKIGVPDHILNKPGKLTPEEREIINQHPKLASKLLSDIEYLEPIIDIPLYHHEKWDGTGYPQGLKAEEIPLPARIFAVVDVWDAMTSKRPYRSAISEFDAVKYITENSGTHFDPDVVFAFLKILQISISLENKPSR